jgi:hypothetical protein
MKPFKFSKKSRDYIKWSKNVKEVRIVPKSRPEPDPAAALQVDMEDKAAQGSFTNMAAVTHTETEFILDFMFLRPDQPRARVLARVISSPVHAKRLCSALRKNLQKYEASFGPVKEAGR